MTLTERCQAGEAKLEQVSTALLDPRPEILDQGETDLQEVIELLDCGPDPSESHRPTSRNDLLRLRNRVRLLALQVQHATNLCQGWAQLHVSQGYTAQGTPALPAGESRSSYEV